MTKALFLSTLPGRASKVDASSQHAWIRTSATKVINNDLWQQQTTESENHKTINSISYSHHI